MIRRSAKMPRSRIDITCPAAGQPLALRKVAVSIPNCRARSVISAANPASVPSGLSASAKTTVASLPDRTTIPRIKSSTQTRSVVLRNMVEPPKDMACSDTGSAVSNVRRPSSSASNVMFNVISLDIEAGGNGTSAFSANKTCPEL